MKFRSGNNFVNRGLHWLIYKIFSFIKNRQKGSILLPGLERKILLLPTLDYPDPTTELLKKLRFAFPLNNLIRFEYLPGKLSHASLLKLIESREVTSHKLEPLDMTQIPQNTKPDYSKFDLILCHQASSLLRIPGFFYKTEIIDPNFYSYTESLVLQHVYYNLLDTAQKDDFRRISRSNFLRLQSRLADRENAWCFLTGPTISDYRSFNIHDNSTRIICNSLVKDTKFLQFIGGPDIITFADPVFHFGASDYAIRFREQMVQVVNTWNSFVVVPDFTVPLLISWFPNLENHIIGLQTMPGDFHFPDSEQMYVKATDNIFTMLMVPLAASLASSIWIAGADGREKKEKYFWKFSPEAQFSEEMKSVFDSHPSFFRDRRYGKYYHDHCITVEKLISHAENAGKSITMVTPSNIPALKKRFIKH